MIAGSIWLLILAAVLLANGFRPKRHGNTPFCARCGYNLTGLSGEVCPECGDPYGRPGGTVFGTRQRRTGNLVAGIVLLGVAAANLVTPLKNVDWYGFMPTSFVLGDLQSGNPQEAQRVWDEVRRRVRAKNLTEKEYCELIDLCLKEHGSPSGRNVTDQMVEYLGKAYLARKLNPRQKEQLLNGVLNCTLDVRPRVAPNDPTPLRFKLKTRTAGVFFRMALHTEVFLIDNLPRKEKFERLEETNSGSYNDDRQLASIPIGRHIATLRLRARLYSALQNRVGSITWGLGESGSGVEETWGPVLHEKPIDLTCKFEVLAEEPSDYIRRVRDPEWAEALPACIGVTHLGWKEDERGWSAHKFGSGATSATLPTNVAADVYVRIDGLEYPVGTAEGSKGGDIGITFRTTRLEGRKEPFKSFDLVLRPSEKVARESLGIYEMWDDVIVKNGLKADCEPASNGRDKKP